MPKEPENQDLSNGFIMNNLCLQGSFGTFRISAYREAKWEVTHNRVGVYSKISGDSNLVIYVMHKKLKSVQILCDNYINCPRTFIRKSHKKLHGFYYVRLIGKMYTSRLKETMQKNSKWRYV